MRERPTLWFVFYGSYPGRVGEGPSEWAGVYCTHKAAQYAASDIRARGYKARVGRTR